MLTLQSSDRKDFPVEKATIVRCSETIRNLVENCDDDDETPVPLPNVNAITLENVLKWAELHKDDPETPAVQDGVVERRAENMSDVDKKYIESLSEDELYEVLLASNYLDIKDLMDLGCKRVILMIKGKTTEEMRAILRVTDDLTPEQKEQIRKENEWCEEKN